MTTPKLDEARLRELAEAATASSDEPWYPPKALSQWMGDEDAAVTAMASPSTILALLDALSAERERGDRACHHIKWLADWIEDDCGAELPYAECTEDARAFLAKTPSTRAG